MIHKTTRYLIDRFEADEMVNTITLKDNLVVDTAKENIYPLVAINFTNRGRTTDKEYHLYSYRIYVLQQRDVRNVVEKSKLMEDTNWLDNLAECESIINNLTNYIDRIEVEEIIDIESLSTLTPVHNYAGSGLDGFYFDIVINTPNTGYCNY